MTQNEVGKLENGTKVNVYREDPNGWVEFSFENAQEKILDIEEELKIINKKGVFTYENTFFFLYLTCNIFRFSMSFFFYVFTNN